VLRASHSGAVDLLAELDAFVPRGEVEAADLARVRHLARSADPAGRTTPVHLTASALVVHPPTERVLLRWHERMGSWLHIGGHIDPGEGHPLVAALREGAEETGLPDLVPWPRVDRPELLQVVVVRVPAGKGEPAHEHADLRYVLATGRPGDVVPESPSAALRWVAVDAAPTVVAEENLREALARVRALLPRSSGPGARPHPPVEGEAAP
jgi:8-oxo-dGTP pyrophosphatase MutT (NUDIX family)